MAKKQSRRLRPAEQAADDKAIIAVQSTPSYQSFNPDSSAQSLAEQSATRDQDKATEIRTHQAYVTARDIACASEWRVHKNVIVARTQMRAQFGDDSNEVQAMGLKKSSERKRPSRSTNTPPTSNSTSS